MNSVHQFIVKPIGERYNNEITIGDKKAIISSIRGRAWITGTHEFTLDSDDPWPEGYRLTDTWPMKK